MKGFTLIELLVVIFIIALLMTLTIGVGRYLTEQTRGKETHVRMAILELAINAYYGATGEYPTEAPPPAEPNPWSPDPDAGQIVFFYAYEAIPRSAELRVLLLSVKQSAKVLQNLPGKCLGEMPFSDYSTLIPVFRDGFEGCLDYRRFGGFGRRPVTISGGSDYKTGTEDDIYSEER